MANKNATGYDRGKRRGDTNAPGYATADRDFSDDELQFLHGMEEFKQYTGKRFPTWTDALYVLKKLGWSKTCAPDYPPEDFDTPGMNAYA